MPRKKTAPTYEAAMQELENIVDKLEMGETPLEESLIAYERGVTLVASLEATLGDAKRRVTLLMPQGEVPFEEADEDETV